MHPLLSLRDKGTVVEEEQSIRLVPVNVLLSSLGNCIFKLLVEIVGVCTVIVEKHIHAWAMREHMATGACGGGKRLAVINVKVKLVAVHLSFRLLLITELFDLALDLSAGKFVNVVTAVGEVGFRRGTKQNVASRGKGLHLRLVKGACCEALDLF